MNLLDKLICKGVAYYESKREEEVIKQLGIPKNSNVRVAYPFVMAHPELVTIGDGTQILADSRIQLYPELVDKKPQLQIGNGCFFGYRLCILVGADISIGNKVLMASDITIVSENHSVNPEAELPYMKQKLRVAPVTIGDNCWIGDKVIILPGVNVGEGCVVGAGAIVTKDIPPYSIAVGNPARVIKRYNFDMHKWVKP